MKLCSVEGCGKAYWAKGFCTNHYKIKRRREDPNRARDLEREYRKTCNTRAGKPFNARTTLADHPVKRPKIPNAQRVFALQFDAWWRLNNPEATAERTREVSLRRLVKARKGLKRDAPEVVVEIECLITLIRREIRS